MENYREKIEAKKREEQKTYRQSVWELESAFGNAGERPGSHRHMAAGLREMLGQILIYYKMDKVLPPFGIGDGEEMDYILNVSGLMKREVYLEGKWWESNALPLICKYRDKDEFVVLLPGKFGGYEYDDGSGKKKRVDKRRAKLFEQQAYCFYRPLSVKVSSAKEFILFFFSIYNFSDWLMLFLTSIFVVAMGLIVPLVNSFIFNQVIPSGTMDDILPVAALLFGVILTSCLFGLLKAIWISRVGEKVRIMVEAGTWGRVLNLPVHFFKGYEAGDLTRRIDTISEICTVVNQNIIPVLLAALFSVVYLFQIRAFSQSMLLPAVAILLVRIGIMVAGMLQRIKVNQKLNRVTNRISGFIYQIYSGMEKIKVSGAQLRVFARWAEMFRERVKYRLSLPFFIRYAEAVSVFLSIGGTMVIYYVVYKNNLSVSVFISFQCAFGSLIASMGALGNVMIQIAYLKPAFAQIMPILREMPETGENKPYVHKLNGDIVLSNVYFRYQSDMPYVLEDMNLTVKQGEYVALVGESGCGKSTLFRMLIGFEKPDKGAVYYDGQDLEGLDKNSVRRRIGTVLQDGRLFAGDIYANISLLAPDITIDEAWEAARKSGIAEDIENMPMGMYTMLSEGGGGISGGQKQRLLIARVLAMKPDVLLFDEATSALDNMTQGVVVHTLSEMSCTRIVIAHRLSTIKQCDRIIYLEKGSVVEEGSYEELMEKNGRFAKLANRQI